MLPAFPFASLHSTWGTKQHGNPKGGPGCQPTAPAAHCPETPSLVKKKKIGKTGEQLCPLKGGVKRAKFPAADSNLSNTYGKSLKAWFSDRSS